MNFRNMNNQELEQSIKQTVNTLIADINSLKMFFDAANKSFVRNECTNWSRSMFEHFNAIRHY